ncbi:ParB/RepB/Spo0J family partition protein [Erythrobacter sp. 3-20A1M]|uniref:ParB/RepB/Spo0J family partition protein n=1 Tax=Erythrobacter sp. 3-20A1M TaxID=2653850 RepID=UPI001BFBF89A|nr:ParB/RepB/Spo0J family partition protein [Erythrobacter sp. 3-20A1M]QWC56807.1 ParB/RepB/Spo0J family partition protein [Erythrobacter sp. 3-20A1M]
MSSSDPVHAGSVPRATDRKKKLGRGLGALLGETRREEPFVHNKDGEAVSRGTAESTGSATTGLASLPVASIEPLPGQPRTRFDEDALDELSRSIAARGVIQPIIVRPLAGDRYQLVAGERRWRAAQKARLHDIPAIVRNLDESEVMALALIENIQREDLNPIEEARAYHQLGEQEGMSQNDIAKLVDKSRSHVANLQRLLALPDDVIALVEEEALSMGHARALIGHDDASSLARQAIAEKLTVRDVERLVRSGSTKEESKGRRGKSPADSAENADIAAVQRHLEEFLGLTVRIKSDADSRSGAVTIRYRTLDQLDLICQRLTGGEI